MTREKPNADEREYIVVPSTVVPLGETRVSSARVTPKKVITGPIGIEGVGVGEYVVVRDGVTEPSGVSPGPRVDVGDATVADRVKLGTRTAVLVGDGVPIANAVAVGVEPGACVPVGVNEAVTDGDTEGSGVGVARCGVRDAEGVGIATVGVRVRVVVGRTV